MPETREQGERHYDLASMLAAALIDRRDEINASRLAHGDHGRIELWPNLEMQHVGIVTVVEDREKLA